MIQQSVQSGKPRWPLSMQAEKQEDSGTSSDRLKHFLPLKFCFRVPRKLLRTSVCVWVSVGVRAWVCVCWIERNASFPSETFPPKLHHPFDASKQTRNCKYASETKARWTPINRKSGVERKEHQRQTTGNPNYAPRSVQALPRHCCRSTLAVK